MKLRDILKEVEENKYRLFVDMDGVVADFDTGLQRVFKVVHGQDVSRQFVQNSENDPKLKKMLWDTVRAYQNEYGGEMWYDLPPTNDAFQLWNYIKHYNPSMLTASGDPKHGAPDQKRRWVKETLGANVPVYVVKKATDKQQYADENHVLIDDKVKALEPWNDANGIGILHTNAKNTLAELKKLGL